MTLSRIATEYAYREEVCAECGGSGVRMGCTNEVECFDCSGEGSWSASCAECFEERPLNGDGICADCATLTETCGDPLLGRAAA